MKNYLINVFGLMIISLTLLTSCATSSSVSSSKSRSTNQYHNGHMRMGPSYHNDRGLIIIDNVDPDYDVPVPVVLPEEDF